MLIQRYETHSHTQRERQNGKNYWYVSSTCTTHVCMCASVYILCVSGLCSIIPFKSVAKAKDVQWKKIAAFFFSTKKCEKRNKSHHDTSNCVQLYALYTIHFNTVYSVYLFHCSCFIHPYRFSLGIYSLPVFFYLPDVRCSLSFVLIMITFICLLFVDPIHVNVYMYNAELSSSKRNAIWSMRFQGSNVEIFLDIIW